MKLLAVYNVFDGLELLKGSIEQIRDSVDCVLIVAQEKSNFGEYDSQVYPYCHYLKSLGLVDEVIPYSPYGGNAMQNETKKRQIGIDYGKKHGFTHFLHLDCDEYYDSENFYKVRFQVGGSFFSGSVVNMKTYYKDPSWCLDPPEDYYVPFIHRLDHNTTTGVKNKYPYYVDPTRRINTKSVERLDSIIMHHFSYIRLDIRKKIQNSTARKNIDKAWIFEEFERAKAGDKIKLYDGRTLIAGQDRFHVEKQIQQFKDWQKKTV